MAHCEHINRNRGDQFFAGFKRDLIHALNKIEDMQAEEDVGTEQTVVCAEEMEAFTRYFGGLVAPPKKRKASVKSVWEKGAEVEDDHGLRGPVCLLLFVSSMFAVVQDAVERRVEEAERKQEAHAHWDPEGRRLAMWEERQHAMEELEGEWAQVANAKDYASLCERASELRELEV